MLPAITASRTVSRNTARRRTGRAVALVALAAATTLALAGCSSPDDAPRSPAWSFVTRPDLTPPIITSTAGEIPGADGSPTSEGNVFTLGVKDLDQNAAMEGVDLVDAAGKPVWVDPTTEAPFDVRVQKYQGKPVLTWWQGPVAISGTGSGRVVIMNQHYQQITTVTTGGDLGAGHADIHESTITKNGTMLLVSYPTVPADLTSVGGPADGWVRAGVVQEVDIATGKVVFEWHSINDIPVSDTYEKLPKGAGTYANPFDYVHLNAVALDGPHSLLVSARNTHTIYKVARKTSKVEWRLGGKRSSFTIPADATFAWQHDVRLQSDGDLTLFDNEGAPRVGPTSRGLRLRLHMKTHTVSLVATYDPAGGDRHSDSQGNVQVLKDGNVVVGWGSTPFYGEYTASGKLLGEMTFNAGTSYRAYRATWHGEPLTQPAAVLRTPRSGTQSVYASWNGATDVARWQVVSGADAASATVVAGAPRSGFETSVPVKGLGEYVAVQPLDASGKVMATTVVRGG